MSDLHDGVHAGLNAAARRSGFSDAQIERAHRVAAGLENLSEPCEGCGEQALRYNRRVQFEGRCAIVCDNCQAHYVDRAELGGVAAEAAEKVGKAMKGISGSKGRRLRRRPQG